LDIKKPLGHLTNKKRQLALARIHEEMLESSDSDFLIRKEIASWVASQELIKEDFTLDPVPDDGWFAFSYWDSGIEIAPPIVKCCVETHQKYFGDRYVLIDATTISDWVDIPIEIKQKRPQMSTTHYSDILRLLILQKYGGIWIDATVYLTGKPELFPDRDFFCFTRERDPRFLASWYIQSKPNSFLLNNWLKMLLDYWKQHEFLIDYFLMHHLFESLYFLNDDFRLEWNSVPIRSAAPPHLLQSALLLDYSASEFQSTLDQTNIHKLTWKINGEIPKGSNIEFLLKGYK